MNETLLFIVFASFCGALACRGKSVSVFAGWFALSFISMWAMKGVFLYGPALLFLILSATFGVDKLSQPSRILFFIAQIFIIGYKVMYSF
jgi:hypothetical protein